MLKAGKWLMVSILLAGCGEEERIGKECRVGTLESCNFSFYHGSNVQDKFWTAPDPFCVRSCIDDGDGDSRSNLYSECFCFDNRPNDAPDTFGDCPILRDILDGTCANKPIPECSIDKDCPDPDPANECVHGFCNAFGTCGIGIVSENIATTKQTPGDCARSICDGGNVVAVYDPSDVPLSAVGDCMSRACDDASESLVSSFDPKDPKDDDAQCTTDVCTLMGTVYQPSTGTPCNEEGGAICLGGSCVPFIPVKCSVTATAQIYDGCDGLEHVGVSIEWSGLTPGSCAGSPTDVGYCPFGESCSVSENGGEPQLGTCL